MQHTGLVIREARKARRLSLRELGELSEVHHSMLSRIENGLVDPSPRVVKAITDALGRHMARDLGQEPA